MNQYIMAKIAAVTRACFEILKCILYHERKISYYQAKKHAHSHVNGIVPFENDAAAAHGSEEGNAQQRQSYILTEKESHVKQPGPSGVHAGERGVLQPLKQAREAALPNVRPLLEVKKLDGINDYEQGGKGVKHLHCQCRVGGGKICSKHGVKRQTAEDAGVAHEVFIKRHCRKPQSYLHDAREYIG